MSEWKEYKLGEITTRIGDGLHGTPQFDNYGDYYFINGNNLINGRIAIKTDTQKVSEQEYLKYSKPLSDRTILLSINGTIGNVALYQGEKCMLGKSACYINVDDSVDKYFTYYVFLNKDFQTYLVETATGTTIPNVPLKGIREYQFKFPPLPEQRAIASVLSSLDDKIDLLHRQNATLEKMAETLFRQWFMEEAKEEWEEKPISFFGNVICGKTPPKSEKTYFGGLIPFIKIPDMHGKVFVFETEDSLTENGKRSQNNKTLPPFSISVSCIATVGLVTLNAYEAQTNQQINSIIPYKEEYRYYLYLYMKSLYDELHNMASGGTATLNLNTGNFSKIGLPYPSQNRLDKFHSRVEILFDKIYSNSKQIRTLTSLRDTLLPKLMSGEVKIKIYSI